MRTTFLNDNSEHNLKETGLKYMQSRIEDFRVFMDNDEGNEDTGPFNEYGLGYDYVELGTWDNQEDDYFRYQLSWGGPSDELRFHEDGTIEYVYMDWFCGVGFDVTGEDWAEWVKEWFNGCDMMNFADKREESGYYDKLYDSQNEDEEEDEDVDEEEAE